MNKDSFLKPILALVLVFLLAELSFGLFNNFGLVVPYKDYFTHKRQRVSVMKGEPWSKQEFENKLYRNFRFQHVASPPDFNDLNQKFIFLLGDSITESCSTQVKDSFHGLSDARDDNISIVPFHNAGASLQALASFLPNYKAFFKRDSGFFKPDLAVFQIRSLSYQGAKTKTKKAKIVQKKEKFLSNFKLDIKYSNKFKDKLFRDSVMGDSKTLSLIAWRVFQWMKRVTGSAPNHEDFIVHPHDNSDWQSFERTVAFLKMQSQKLGIKVAVILAPSPEWFNEYQYTHKLNEEEKRYQEIFAKYGIPYEYAVDEFLEFKKADEKLFWEDHHPNILGNRALSKSLDKLISKSLGGKTN